MALISVTLFMLYAAMCDDNNIQGYMQMHATCIVSTQIVITPSVYHNVWKRIKPLKTALGVSGKVPERPKYTGSESSNIFRMCVSSFRLTYISSST